jgi:hypothetical protein
VAKKWCEEYEEEEEEEEERRIFFVNFVFFLQSKTKT